LVVDDAEHVIDDHVAGLVDVGAVSVGALILAGIEPGGR
jgi:hypothetical protein